MLTGLIILDIASLTMSSDCPGIDEDFSCFDNDFKKPGFGYLPVVVSLLSCTFSVLGSIITILPYILWKDVRQSGIRKTITYLAIADLFTASSYIMASINYLVYDEDRKNHPISACRSFDDVCQIQAYISSFASYSSFWWTSILALFFYWSVVKGEKGDRYFPLYHVLSWGSPILVMLPLLATGSLGYSYFSAGGWCFIKGHHSDNSYSLDYGTVLKTLAGGKAFEIATYIWVIVFYVIIQYKIRKKQKDANNYSALTLKMQENCRKIEQKTLAIPIAFILLRMWGTLHFLFSIIVYASPGAIDGAGCTSKGIYALFMILVLLQSFGDGGQGWCNAILYIALSPKIRNRLFHSFLSLIKKVKPHISSINHSTSHDGEQHTRGTTSVLYKASDSNRIVEKDALEETQTPNISSVTISIDYTVQDKYKN